MHHRSVVSTVRDLRWGPPTHPARSRRWRASAWFLGRVACAALAAACASSGGASDVDRAPQQAPADSPTGSAPPVDAPRSNDSSSTTTSSTTSTPPTTIEAFDFPFERVEGVATTEDLDGGESMEQWTEGVPGVEEIWVRSSLDGSWQPSLWVPPHVGGSAPLLVVLHSWSNNYTQHLGIPYAQWAQANGWAMLHPQFRGVFARPEATGSDLAVTDVLDAIDYAVAVGAADPSRVYVTGYSGGAMMALLLAGRHPARVAGAAAWVPIYDLVDFYDYHGRAATPYLYFIAASCGGDLYVDPDAVEECRTRSPQRYLDAARAAGVPVYLGAGIADELVPADHAARAFNALAAEGDRLPAAVVDQIGEGRLPEGIITVVDGVETYFRPHEPEVLLSRRSGPVTLVLFDGAHELVVHPTLAWMVDLDRAGR